MARALSSSSSRLNSLAWAHLVLRQPNPYIEPEVCNLLVGWSTSLHWFYLASPPLQFDIVPAGRAYGHRADGSAATGSRARMKAP